MTRSTLLFFGLSCSFLVVVAVAGDRGETTYDSGAGVAEAAAGQETVGETGATSGNNKGRASGVKGSERRPASTATAVGIIHEQVKEGKMNIQVDTDAGPLP